jgi:hypothetical protein
MSTKCGIFLLARNLPAYAEDITFWEKILRSVGYKSGVNALQISRGENVSWYRHRAASRLCGATHRARGAI